jgi:type II secretory pathway pseudopilin PulG
VEAVVSMAIVATMFAAAMAAVGAAARDRRTQAEIRQGRLLAGMLMAEITAQRYTDGGAFGRAPGASTTDRSNWKDVDDYHGLDESPPKDRSGIAVPGCAGWRWRASVQYAAVPSLASSGTPVSGGLLGGLIGSLGAAAGSVQGTSATDTGLKQITVTVTAPSGKQTVLTGYRCATGVVDVLPASSFRVNSTVTVTVGDAARPVSVGAPNLNIPAPPP